jgi:uncharacterized membrane protein YkgB
MATNTQKITAISRNSEIAGLLLIRYGVVLILFWIGLLKFTSYEAMSIQEFVENSPFMSWMYSVWSVQAASNVIGVIEVASAVLMAARPRSALASAIGSAMAVITFLLTLSFLLSTPQVWQQGLGFPFLSAVPGQFLLKDAVLLGGAVWSLGESLKAMKGRRNGYHLS